MYEFFYFLNFQLHTIRYLVSHTDPFILYVENNLCAYKNATREKQLEKLVKSNMFVYLQNIVLY